MRAVAPAGFNAVIDRMIRDALRQEVGYGSILSRSLAETVLTEIYPGLSRRLLRRYISSYMNLLFPRFAKFGKNHAWILRTATGESCALHPSDECIHCPHIREGDGSIMVCERLGVVIHSYPKRLKECRRGDVQ